MQRILTNRLLLREWKETDVEDLYEYAKSDLVGPNAGWKPHKDVEESKEIIQMFITGKDTYAIELCSENKVIGGIGLHDREPDETLSHLNQKELGYVLNPTYWGKGFVPEAVNGLLKYGFGDLNLDVIWCGHYDFNHNSKRVNEKCGFTYRFDKNVILERLDNKEVTTLYYNIYQKDYKDASNN